jgi:NADH-quinone oxidoreductase subunit K
MDFKAIFLSGPDNLSAYLVLSAFLFACGVYALISRRNAVAILMGVELILNAAGINFIAFARFGHSKANGAHLDGHIFTLFIIVLAAAEAAVALALVLAVFQTHKTIALNDVDEMKL